MMKRVLRPWLGLVAAFVALPCTALGQTPQAEPTPLVVPPPAPAPVEPAPEPAPAQDAPTMAPLVAEPPVVTAPRPAETPAEEGEEAPPPAPTISGYVEAAYHINFSDPDQGDPVPLQGFYTPPGHGFVLHAAHLAVAHSFNENVSAVIEIDVGYDALANSGLEAFWKTPTFFDIQEAYATYKSGIFSMTAGKFVTYQGIEVVEGPLNPTITRGYLFGLAEPVSHTGVKFHFTGETIDFGIGVVNGWDAIVDNNSWKTFIFKLGLTPSESFLVNFNGTFGAEGENTDAGHRLSLDLTGAWTASQSFALWFQGNFGMDAIGNEPGADTVSWFGVGIQPTYTGESFTFGARLELFSDPDNARSTLGPDGTYVNVTITPGFILAEGFKVRAELRADIATEDYLGDSDDPGKAQFTAALGAEYVF